MYSLHRPVVGDNVHTMSIDRDKVDIIGQAFLSFGVAAMILPSNQLGTKPRGA
jgi:hypothetical protein